MNWCNGCRRGISNFYNGKSKSFTSLTEASSSSNIKDIAKAENAYTRKRRNLLAFNHVWEKNRNFPLKSHGGGISKRPLSSSRSTLAFAVAMSSSSSESISNSSEDSISRSPPLPSSPLPPRHPQSRSTKNSILSSSPPQQNSSAWRSFSMVDLQQCATSATTTTSAYQLWTKTSHSKLTWLEKIFCHSYTNLNRVYSRGWCSLIFVFFSIFSHMLYYSFKAMACVF